MRVRMMFGKPGVPHAELIGQPNQLGHFGINGAGGSLMWPFKMVGYAEDEFWQCEFLRLMTLVFT
jgi:hypothetical protein